MRRILFLCLMLFISQAYSEPPPAQVVFQFEVKARDPNTFILNWDIKPGYFLYRDRIYFAQTPSDFLELSPLKLPHAQTKIDSLGQSIFIYRNKLSIPVNMVGFHAGENILDLHYQGCSDDGFCYPPESKNIKLTIDKNLSLIHASVITPEKVALPMTSAPPPAPNAHFSEHHWSITLLIFLGLGLLLSFTPCVLPMIPVLSSILVGHGKNLSPQKAFFLSLSYVLSMSVTYAMIGAVIALLGHNLQVVLQSPFFITSFSIVFVLLAFSMLGGYNLELPTAWRTKLANLSYRHASGHYLGTAIMGALSTLILSPCVTAPLIGALSYIAQTGHVLFGTAALFFLGFGMGLPLLLMGATLGHWLPHAGSWMNVIKTGFGLLLLAVAIDLMSRIIPAFISMLLWAGLLIFSGLMLGAFKKASSNFMRLMRGLGILLLTYGILITIGASLGNTNPLKPLLSSKASQTAQPDIALVVTTMDSLKAALTDAMQKNQAVLLDFYADWCTSCKAIESNILKNPEALKALNHVQLIKIDLSINNDESRALLQTFNVIAPPTFIFVDASGHEHENLRLVGDISLSTFLTHLNRLKKGSWNVHEVTPAF